MDVFVVAGYGTYTPDSQNVGIGICIEAGQNNTGCPEWRMFRQDVQRSGYLSSQDIAASCNALSIDMPSESMVSIFPNPAKDYIEIQTDELLAGVFKFELFDLQGRLQFQREYEGAQQRIEQEWTPGLYIWRVSTASQSISGKLEILR